jgi:hypothetical protein
MKEIFNANYLTATYCIYPKSAHKILPVNDGTQPYWTYIDLTIKVIGTETVVIIEQPLKYTCMGYI